jgi:hypothetical protein
MGGMADRCGFTTGCGLSPWQVSLLSESQSNRCCNSDTIESWDGIGVGFGVAIVTAKHGKRGHLATCQRLIVGRVCIGMIRAFLWDREPPKGCSSTGMCLRALVVELHKGS